MMNNSTCPVCNYEHPEGGSIEVEFNGATQAMSCPRCDAAWTDCYYYAGASFSGAPDNDGDRHPDDYEAMDPEPMIGLDYWKNEDGEYRLG
jgi:Zn-finger nucleic acid-binding protein